MMCLDDQLLGQYIDGELQEPWLSQIAEHIEWCEVCKHRLEELKNIKQRMQDSVMSDEDIESRQNRVLKYMEKNVLNKKKKFNIRKILNKKILMPLASACIMFCFCLIIFHPTKNEEILLPEVSSSLSIESVIPVRTTDNYTTSQTLKNYSLEDILKYLDSKGYDVSISPKPIISLEQGEVIKNSEAFNYTLDYIITPMSTFAVFPLKTNFLFKFAENR